MDATHAMPGTAVVKTGTAPHPATATHENALTAVEHGVEGGFKHVMDWITGAGKVALTEIITYTPKAEELAEMLLPQYKALEPAIAAMVVQGCQLLLTGIINAQQKYAADANVPGAQKSADVLTSVGGTVVSILGLAKVGAASEDYVQRLINAIVAILKVRPAPTTVAA